MGRREGKGRDGWWPHPDQNGKEEAGAELLHALGRSCGGHCSGRPAFARCQAPRLEALGSLGRAWSGAHRGGRLYAPVKARDAAARCHWPRRSEAWPVLGSGRAKKGVWPRSGPWGSRACAHRERFWAQAAWWLRVPTPPSEASPAVAVWPLAARHPLWAWRARPALLPAWLPLPSALARRRKVQDIRKRQIGR